MALYTVNIHKHVHANVFLNHTAAQWVCTYICTCSKTMQNWQSHTLSLRPTDKAEDHSPFLSAKKAKLASTLSLTEISKQNWKSTHSLNVMSFLSCLWAIALSCLSPSVSKVSPAVIQDAGETPDMLITCPVCRRLGFPLIPKQRNVTNISVLFYYLPCFN